MQAVATTIGDVYTPTDPKNRIQVEYDPVYSRVVISLPPIIKEITFGRKLQYMLGLKHESYRPQYNIPVTKVTSDSPIDLRGGFDCMYVYCGIVEPQIVGDCLTPLLRVINVEGKQDDVVAKTFDNPHYVPVAKREFNSIEINIKDDADRFVRFKYGKVIVKLHFRRRKATF